MIYPLVVIIATLYLAGAIIYFGRRLPAYSHIKNTISELGESGSVFEKRVGYGIFLPVALLLIGVSSIHCLTGIQNEPQLNLNSLAVCVGIGYFVAAIFPCDPGSPISGSGRQNAHNLGGAVEYIGGAYFLLQTHFSVTQVIGKFIFFAVAAISFSPVGRGLVQRIAEAGLFGSMIFLSWQV